jgi:hypothetical protein
MLRQISLGSVGLVVGGILTVVGFVAYASANATLNLVGFFYGIPVLLGGLALKSAELKPVPFTVPTASTTETLRDQQITDTLKQVINDVTRYRYGQNDHLDDVLTALGLSPTDEERPTLIGLREEAIDGAYTLVLEFDSPMITMDTWQQRREKMERFFGPNVRVKFDKAEEDFVDVSLIVTPKLAPT